MGSGSTLQLTPEFLAQDRRPQARIGIGIVTALSGIIVLIRVYARWFMIRSFGWDDGLICIAMVCFYDGLTSERQQLTTIL